MKFKLLKTFETIATPRTIVKFKPFLYGTKDDIHNPECKVMFKIAIWVTDHVPQNNSSFHHKVIATKMFRVEVDFDKRVLLKDGQVVDVSNASEVIKVLEDSMDSMKEVQK